MRRSGLYPLRDLWFLQLDDSLICSFVEQWQPDTSSFDLPISEMTITLDDISVLLHLPIIGRFFDMPMYFAKIDATNTLVEYLGVDYEDAAYQIEGKGVYVQLKWLREMVYKAIHERRWEHAAGAHVLYLLGTTVFTDKSGSRVKVRYLQALVDLEATDSYIRGEMALAYIYDQVNDASITTCRQVDGYATLIHVYIIIALIFS